jgi:hypothetical protein
MNKENVFQFKENLGIKPNIVYVVTMIRISTVDCPHNYVLGVYSNTNIAIEQAEAEVTWRAQKYKYAIQSWILDNPMPEEKLNHHKDCDPTIQ